MADQEPIEGIYIGEIPFIIAEGIARMTSEAAFRAVGFTTVQNDLTES